MSTNSRQLSLDDAISDVRKRVERMIPGTAQQQEILKLICERTKSFRAGIHLIDPLGASIGAETYPPPEPAHAKFIAENGPIYRAISMCDEIGLYSWNQKPEKAFEVPWSQWHETLTHKLIYRHVGHDHVMLIGFPHRRNGNQVWVSCARQKYKPPEATKEKDIAREGLQENAYAYADWDNLTKIFKAFKDELSLRDPEGMSAEPPPVSLPPLILDGNFKSTGITPLHYALISRFFGEPEIRPDGAKIPDKMIKAIAIGCEKALEEHVSRPESFDFEMVGYYHGRLLKGSGRRLRNGSIEIELIECVAQLKRLRKTIVKCRAEPPEINRELLFRMSALIAENIKDEKDVARRLNKDASFVRSYTFKRHFPKAKAIWEEACRD